MKFADQTMRRVNQIPTKGGDIISSSLWLLSNSKLSIKSPTIKMSKDRKVLLDRFRVLHSKQLNCKSVKMHKSHPDLFGTLLSNKLNSKL